jgi:transcriptional regulator with XRE-family HTH domain
LIFFIANTINFNIKLENAKLIDNNEPIIERLRELKAKSGLTVAKIAKNSNGELTESTINRILMGKTKNPTITTVIMLAKAMGFKATDPFDETIKVDVQAEEPQVLVPTVDVNVYNQMIQMYKDIIATKDQTHDSIIKTKDKWIKLLFCLLFIFMLLAAIFIGIDLASGEFGLFRY